MHPLAIPLLAMGSVGAYLCTYHLILFARRPQAREHLAFGILCAGVALYDFMSMGLYSATSLEEGLRWQHRQFDAICVISAMVPWFVTQLVKIRVRWPVWALAAFYLLLLAAAHIAPESMTLSPAMPAIKPILWRGAPLITYYEGEIGLIYQIAVDGTIVGSAYAFCLLLWKGGKVGHRGFFIATLVLYTSGLVNDACVAGRVYRFIYLSEYAFLLFVVSMAYVLLSDFLDLHDAVAELNLNLNRKVERRTREIQKLNDDLRKLAELDGLTCTYNRRFFDQYLKIELERALNERRRKGPRAEPHMNFGLALLDIDDFKRINDRFGHPAGDEVLKQLVELVRGHCFSRDVLCRYGGEEFALILTQTSAEGLLQATEKIRHEVETHVFLLGDGIAPQRITISLGLVGFSELSHATAPAMVKLADARLYLAKSMGKNRVVCSDDVAATSSTAG